jgi:diguanylate cyclase (GGDEF)-like protein/PAS domain S-box-containing protein
VIPSLALALDFEPLDLAFGLVILVAIGANWRGYAWLRRSERRARRQAEKYLESAGSAIVAFDRKGRVQIANTTVCALLARPVSEVVGADWITLAVPEAGQRQSRQRLEAVMSGSRDVVPQYEHELVRRDGSTRLIRWTDVLTRDEHGRVTGLLKSGLDITEQRAAELEVRQATKDLEILNEIAHAVATADDARGDVVAGVQRLTGSVITALLEPTPERDALCVTAATYALLPGFVLRLDEEGSGAVSTFLSGEPFFAPDFRTNPAVSARLKGLTTISSALFQPVLVDGAIAGVLIVAWEETRDTLTDRARHLVEVGAYEAAIALMRAAGTDRLRTAAFTDPLTGIANRRAFELELAAALARARKQGHPLSVALVDLNALKELNDSEGHEAGDALLRDAAASWQAELRPSDLLARLGGDEFAIILPSDGEHAGQRIADRLRQALRHPAGCGVGIALWDGKEDAASLLRRGDQALYADKARSATSRIGDLARLSALARTGLSNRSQDGALDEVTRTVSWLLDVPTSLVSLVGADCLIVASTSGTEQASAEDRVTPLSDSFCQHAVATRRPLIISDARENEALASLPSVRDLEVIAYAGVPLIDDHGQALGALCAVDSRPRDWSELDISVLTRLAGIAVARLVELQAAGGHARAA